MKKKRAPTVDFLAGTYDDIERHGMELLVFDVPELSAVLRGHMLIERVIEALAPIAQPELLVTSTEKRPVEASRDEIAVVETLIAPISRFVTPDA